MVGKIFDSNNSGKMEVVSSEGAGKYKVRFLETGYETVTEARQIRDGSVKDRKHPSVANVGYLGMATTTTNPKLYARWKRMIQSCYDQYHLDYHANGEKGIVVADEWHSYENYQIDLLDLWDKAGRPEKYRVIRNGDFFCKSNVMVIK